MPGRFQQDRGMQLEKRNLLDLERSELEKVITGMGEKRFRAGQVFEWLSKGAASFVEMTNVPKSLRGRLEEDGWYIGLPDAERIQRSKDGTVKCLFRFDDCSDVKPCDAAEATDEETCGAGTSGEDAADVTAVESVFMKYSYGNSICISSQCGCRMGCTFCASTMDGLRRGLTGGEMLGQVLAMRNLTGEDIGHVVVMGMGEPFDNYEGLSSFINLIHDEKGYGLGLRNITVSTCGLIPGIERFAEDFPQVNLAVSLHAPNQKLRERTMPVAKKYAYDDLLAACRQYTEKTGRRITFEYAVIDGVNDSEACAEELSARLKGWLTHVNLIPLNEVEGREYRKAQDSNIRRFREILERSGVAVTVRRTLGSDIDAACGQLRRSR